MDELIKKLAREPNTQARKQLLKQIRELSANNDMVVREKTKKSRKELFNGYYNFITQYKLS